MGLTFLQLANELISVTPDLNPLLAKRYVNRALREAYRSRNWSFLTERGFLSVPARVTTGTVSVIQFSDQVTPSVAAKAIWDVMGLDIPITSRQFRVGTKAVYRITAYDGTVATLDKKYQEATDAAASYSILKCFYPAPESDFRRWISVVDTQTQRPIEVNVTSEFIDRHDPNRVESGTPVRLAALEGLRSDSGRPLFELHPFPTSAQFYAVRYLRRGADLSSDSDTLPDQLSDEVIIEGALYYAYGKAGRLVDARNARNVFDELLADAQREDEEIFPQNFFQFDYDGDAGYGDEYARTHALYIRRY